VLVTPALHRRFEGHGDADGAASEPAALLQQLGADESGYDISWQHEKCS
jgi:hypothetical protein